MGGSEREATLGEADSPAACQPEAGSVFGLLCGAALATDGDALAPAGGTWTGTKPAVGAGGAVAGCRSRM